MKVYPRCLFLLEIGDFMASVALVLRYLRKEAADSVNKTAFNVTTIYSVRCQETRPMFSCCSHIGWTF